MQVQCQYALKQNFMKNEFKNSIRKLSFLCCQLDIKIAWIKPWFGIWEGESNHILQQILLCMIDKGIYGKRYFLSVA